MEPRDIHLPLSIQPSWDPRHPYSIKLCIPPFNVDEMKSDLLRITKAESTQPSDFDFSLKYKDTEKPFSIEKPFTIEDDLYLAIRDKPVDSKGLIVINIREKKREKPTRIKEEVLESFINFHPTAPTPLKTLENSLTPPSAIHASTSDSSKLDHPPVTKKRKNSKAKQNVVNLEANEVNQDGSIDDQLYKGTDKVNCAFCKTSNLIEGAIKYLGEFHGPFEGKDGVFYVHFLCAMWSSGVTYDDRKKRFYNLDKEVKRCKKLKCSFCGKDGAGAGCEKKECNKTYHWKCVYKKNTGCRADVSDYSLLCPEHCKEEDDRKCENCGKEDDEEAMLICDKCSKGYHTYCLKPALAYVPEGDWFCKKCTSGNTKVKTEHR